TEPCFAFCASATSLSRSGPTWPLAPAGLNVWHPPQPFEANSFFPAAASPFAVEVEVVVAGSVPSTVSGAGLTVLPLPQPAATSASAAARGTRPRRDIAASVVNAAVGRRVIAQPRPGGHRGAAAD